MHLLQGPVTVNCHENVFKQERSIIVLAQLPARGLLEGEET